MPVTNRRIRNKPFKKKYLINIFCERLSSKDIKEKVNNEIKAFLSKNHFSIELPFMPDIFYLLQIGVDNNVYNRLEEYVFSSFKLFGRALNLVEESSLSEEAKDILRKIIEREIGHYESYLRFIRNLAIIDKANLFKRKERQAFFSKEMEDFIGTYFEIFFSILNEVLDKEKTINKEKIDEALALFKEKLRRRELFYPKSFASMLWLVFTRLFIFMREKDISYLESVSFLFYDASKESNLFPKLSFVKKPDFFIIFDFNGFKAYMAVDVKTGRKLGSYKNSEGNYQVAKENTEKIITSNGLENAFAMEGFYIALNDLQGNYVFDLLSPRRVKGIDPNDLLEFIIQKYRLNL